jgi:O-antigen biosynthesis protein
VSNVVRGPVIATAASEAPFFAAAQSVEGSLFGDADQFRPAQVLFFDPARHNEALALLSAEALQKRQLETAFMFADRKCRRPTPSARDFLLRATASRLMGYEGCATEDLERAFEIDPTDELVSSSVLVWGPQALHRLAAASFIAGASGNRETLVLAMRALESAGVPIASRMRDHAGMHAGWVAWRAGSVLELRIHRGGLRSLFVLDPDPMHPLAGHGWSAAEISVEIESPRLKSVSFLLDGKSVLRTCPASRQSVLRDSPMRALMELRREAPTHVHVIVPVYEDYHATRACLDSLEKEGSRIEKHITVIDDCTPSAELRALLEQQAARGLFTLIQNDENLGFARSVNLALDRIHHGDVLLLNSDALLPRGAIDRLASTAYSEGDIGTVTPISNNGEFTSFPKPNVENALASSEEIQSLNDAARAANGAGIVDLPNGIGFCLYITRACVDAVGRLSELYSRGYYEDVEFCLKAREIGFRNVCATGVFVGHLGASSFLGEKRDLVVRNLAILERRFPAHPLECATFLRADPLTAARAALEERLVPDGPVVLLVSTAGSAYALVLERASQIEAADSEIHCVSCEFSALGARAILKSLRGSAPQSLAFQISDPSGLARLQAYAKKTLLRAVEIFDPESLPDAILPTLFNLQAPLRVAFGDLRWICSRGLALEKSCSNAERCGRCDRCSPAPATHPRSSDKEALDGSRMRDVFRNAETIIPLDRMASAFCTAYLKPLLVSPCPASQHERTIAARLNSNRPTLGVLCPEATPETDRQIATLGRIFLRAEIDVWIVVLGLCVDELGIMASDSVFVAGRVARHEYARVFQQYRITKLFSPYRTRHFGLVDTLGAAYGLKKAYFDWSFGALEKDAGDLSLDPRICLERAALEVGAWLINEPID